MTPCRWLKSEPRRYIIAYPLLLWASWIVAWTIDIAARGRFNWDARIDTIYWIAMKVIVWVLPVLLVIRVLERASIVQFLELRHALRGVLWGGAVGSVLIVVTFVGKTLPQGTALHVPSLTLALLNAVVVAPIVEEITFRGFVQKRLELNGRSFWTANLIATLAFVAMHVPGWIVNRHVTSIASFTQAIGSLAMLSLLFGWTKKRSESLYAAIAVHAVNNVYAALFP